MALVVGIDLVAERLLRVVEHHRDVRRLHFVEALAQQLEQHVGEGKHAPDRQPVAAGQLLAALLRGREHREIGAENVG